MIPFGGITFVVHGIVIIVNLVWRHIIDPIIGKIPAPALRFFYRKEPLFSTFSNKHPRLVLVFSLGIIMVITSITLVLAGASLRSSLSHHSNFDLVATLARSRAAVVAAPAALPMPDATPVPVSESVVSPSTLLPIGYPMSLVDLLDAAGVESSFEYRAEIAARANIERYVGSASQNIYLLQLLTSDTILQQNILGGTPGSIGSPGS